MQRTVWLAGLCIAGWLAVAAAQGDDRIELFTDEAMTTCGLLHTGAAFRSIYMFQTGSGVATAAEFSVPQPACWTGATWLADVVAPGFLAIGSSQTDLSIVYTNCRMPPVYLGRIDYLVTGTAPSCCTVTAGPAQSATPGMWVVDCVTFELRAASAGGVVTVNPTPACPCDLPPPPPPPPAPSRIELFADQQMSGCGLADNAAGVRSVYMFHTGSGKATGSEFSAPRPACWTGATWLGDVIAPGLLSIGNSQTDLSMAYVGCRDLPLYLGRIDYFATGASPLCCRYGVSQAPLGNPPGIWVVDCNYEGHLVTTAGGVTINPTPECPCDLEPPLRVQTTTWGKIKSMYRSAQ